MKIIVISLFFILFSCSSAIQFSKNLYKSQINFVNTSNGIEKKRVVTFSVSPIEKIRRKVLKESQKNPIDLQFCIDIEDITSGSLKMILIFKDTIIKVQGDLSHYEYDELNDEELDIVQFLRCYGVSGIFESKDLMSSTYYFFSEITENGFIHFSGNFNLKFCTKYYKKQ